MAISVVPDGTCVIVTLAPAIGRTSAPNTKPVSWLVVSWAAASCAHTASATPAPMAARRGVRRRRDISLASGVRRQLTPGMLQQAGPPPSGRARERSFLRDHDRRGVRVAADDRGHHGGIDDGEALDAADAQRRIDDRHAVAPHSASADGMIDGVGAATDPCDERVVAGAAGEELSAPVRHERRTLHDIARALDAREERLDVLARPEIVR